MRPAAAQTAERSAARRRRTGWRTAAARALGALGALVALGALGLACLPAGAAAAPDDSLRAAAARWRAQRDSALAADPESPLPAAARARWAGLAYFPYDPRFRVPIELHAYARQRPIRRPATDGSWIEVERFGLAIGAVLGTPFRLAVYRVPDDGRLEVFFTDPTNGVQTYAAGRYVTLERQPDGRRVLDFNAAYNPYCAYDPAYACPLPPPENALPVPVRAGERAYEPAHPGH